MNTKILFYFILGLSLVLGVLFPCGCAKKSESSQPPMEAVIPVVGFKAKKQAELESYQILNRSLVSTVQLIKALGGGWEK